MTAISRWIEGRLETPTMLHSALPLAVLIAVATLTWLRPAAVPAKARKPASPQRKK
jgi:hypothetical protein